MKEILTRIKRIEQHQQNSNKDIDRRNKLKAMFDFLKNGTNPNDGFFRGGFENLKRLFE